MRKIILKWLLKEKEIKDYWKLFEENIKIREEHIKTLKDYGDTLDKMRQLIEVCVKHGIDVNEELEV